MEYSELTDKINSLLSVDWTNIAGNLDKISESSLGAAWGLGNGKLYMCLLPCTGNWIPQLDNVLDIATDDTLVYVLLQNELRTKNGNGQGEWNSIPIPAITQIFSSGSYIWGQGTQLWKLPKPGTTGNWMLAKDQSINITSASTNSLYGVQNGKAYKTDEMQSSWSLLPQFKGMFTGIIGNEESIYGIDDQKLVHKCIGDSCSTLQLSKPIKNLSVQSKNLWATSDTSGDLGNIYFKNDERDITQIRPLDVQRDQAVEQVQKDYENSTYAGMLTKQIDELKTFFIDVPPRNKDLEDNTKFKLHTLHNGLDMVYVILVLLLLLILNYLVLGKILGESVHLISLLILISGIFYYTIK